MKQNENVSLFHLLQLVKTIKILKKYNLQAHEKMQQ